MPYVDLRDPYDTHIDEAYPNSNWYRYKYNNKYLIPAGEGNVAGFVERIRAFLKFTRTAWNVPAGANVTSATLYVYSQNINGSTSATHTVYANSSSWSPSTLTWNNHDKLGVHSGYRDTKSVGEYQWIAFDVSQYVKDALTNSTLRETGLRISNNPNGVYGWWTDFLAYGEGAYSPYIRVWYDALPPTISRAYAASDGTIAVEGGGKSGAAAVDVYKATSSGGSYSRFGVAADINTTTWGIKDAEKAAAPGAPTLGAVTAQDSSFGLSWSAGTQATLVRYYKALRRLSDGTASVLTSYVSGSVTPTLSRYVLQRRRSDSTVWSTIYDGSGTSFSDPNILPDYQYYYRVMAVNNQGTGSIWSNESSQGLTRPSAPTLETLAITSDLKFRLTGSSGSPEAMSVYMSSDGTNYSKLESFTGATTTYQRDILQQAAAPPSPVQKQPLIQPGLISLSWTQEVNPALKRWFKTSQTKNGVESLQSAPQMGSISPAVNIFVLERRILGVEANFREIWRGSDLSYSDINVVFDVVYEYRLRSGNAQGNYSTPSILQITSAKPAPPTALKVYQILTAEGHEALRVAGAGIAGADSLRIERSSDGGVSWSSVGNAILTGTAAGEEWHINDNPPHAAPNSPGWSPYSFLDSSGITLRWERASNPTTTYSYRAIRVVTDTEGTPSPIINAELRPEVASYTLERREAGGVFRPIASGLGAREHKDVLNDDPAFITALKSNMSYEYRLQAYNRRGLAGTYSIGKSFKTFDLPPTPPKIAIPKPVLSNGFPQGKTDVPSVEGVVRLGWSYSDASGSPQESYELAISYMVDSALKKRYWNGTSWGADGVVHNVKSRSSVVNVSTTLDAALGEAIRPGPSYTVHVKAYSEAGGSSTPVAAAETDTFRTAAEEETTWTFTVAVFDKAVFDLRRRVSRVQKNTFDLRRYVSNELPAQYEKSLLVTWEVEEQLPLEVRPEGWEGTGSSWPYTIFDNNMQPEPYGKIDFERDGVVKTFTADERGRLLLHLPQDLEPGQYTIRERGPSMAPRTTENYPVVDPAIIYSHGHRHGADGDDPIYGINDSQIAEDANILPRKIAGGAVLDALVSEFGSDFVAALEKRVSAGHANYAISGFGVTFDSPASTVSIAAGVCWANGRLRKPAAIAAVLASGVTYRAYVEEDAITVAETGSFPVDSCPLYVLTQTGGVLTTTDARLSHPNNTVAREATPVRWGARNTYDISYRSGSLGAYLETLEENWREHTRTESQRKQAFEADRNRVVLDIEREAAKRDRAAEAILAASYAVSLKHIYALQEGRPAPYLSQISAFSRAEGTSPLSTFVIKPSNRKAILPTNWSRAIPYILRTNRVNFAPSNYLEFVLLYENTGAIFEVLGSLNDVGYYRPQGLGLIRQFDSPAVGGGNDWQVSVYRMRVPNTGTEAVIELRCYGGAGGAVLRGYALHAA